MEHFKWMNDMVREKNLNKTIFKNPFVLENCVSCKMEG